MPLAPLHPDPVLSEQDDWLKRARAQMDRANAALPEIINDLRRAGALRPMKPGPFQSDPEREYIPGFDEDWTIS